MTGEPPHPYYRTNSESEGLFYVTDSGVHQIVACSEFRARSMEGFRRGVRRLVGHRHRWG